MDRITAGTSPTLPAEGSGAAPARSAPAAEVAGLGQDRAELRSEREKRPLVVSTGVGFPNGIYAGVDYNINDRWAVGGSIGYAHTLMDYEAHGRYYFGRMERFGAYAETGASLIHTVPGTTFVESPGLHVGGMVSQSLGVEFRAHNGLTFNASLGAGYAGMQDVGSLVVPVVKLGLGYAF